RHPEHRPGFELFDHLEGDVPVVVAEEQGAESHHEIEDLVAVDVVDVAAISVIGEKRMRFEVPDVALDPAGGDPSRPAPELPALLVSRQVLSAELLGRQLEHLQVKTRSARAPKRRVRGSRGPSYSVIPLRYLNAPANII